MGSSRKIAMFLILLLVFMGINFITPVNLLESGDTHTPKKTKLPTAVESTQFFGPYHSNQPSGLEPALGRLGTKRINVLFMGIDARAREASRSDSIILLSINPETCKATVLSVLRDTYVTIPTASRLRNRINSAFAFGGVPLSIKTVSQLLQVPIQYYVVTDFLGFEKVVDAVGGVELDVEKQMDYSDDGVFDIHLKPGRQVLNGRQALSYARYRHDIRGDFARVERQRKLLQAILDKAQGIQGFYYLPKIFQAMRPYINTNLDFTTATQLAYVGYKVTTIKTYTIPGEAEFTSQNINGMAVLVPNLQRLRKTVQQLLP